MVFFKVKSLPVHEQSKLYVIGFYHDANEPLVQKGHAEIEYCPMM